MSQSGNEQVNTPETEAKALESEVKQAMGGMSIEDLMAQSLNKKNEESQGGDRKKLDPARPVRGGRPSARNRHSHYDDAHPNPDNVKKGKIVEIRDGKVLVDLGGKSQGICPLDQFDTVQEGEDLKGVEVGQEYEFIYKGYDAREGLVNLARKGAVQHGAWETLSAGDTVEATVTGVTPGGLECRVGASRAFIPASQVDVRFHKDLSAFLNQRLTCIVSRVDRERRSISLSRRDVLAAEQEKAAEKIWGELSVGQVREGKVRSVQAYGAFVDLGGIDGLLHVSAMSHQRVSDPKKIVKEGDTIQVMVTNLDKDKKRVSLSLKQLQKDPWANVTSDYTIGQTVTGTVKRTVDFGAFVELAPGVEGLVHVSQIALKRINKPSDVVKEGDTVTAKVLGVDTEKKRISLSMSAVEREQKIASGEIKAEEAKPVAAAPATPAKPVSNKPRKPLKGGL